MKIMPVPAEEPPRCGAQPSKRSSARCELPPGHRYETERENFHVGRTTAGYWKMWPAGLPTDP